MYAAQYGHVGLVELLLELGHEEEVISVVIMGQIQVKVRV
jgi:hypothetical protein